MKDAKSKTESLQRLDLSIELLEPNPLNPNKMGPAEFNLLVDNIEKTGLTEPILVRAIEGGKYRVVGGHHRCEAARYLNFKEVPCVVITDPDFDEEAEQFQLVRMNAIRGKMDPKKFIKLYDGLSQKYNDTLLQDMFGFADSDEFKKLIAQAAKSLPAELQEEFKEAAKEIKTIDELAKLLNEMLAKHGDSLPYGYMVVDFGGQESIWLRMTKGNYADFLDIGKECRIRGRTLDGFMAELLKLIAKDPEAYSAIWEAAPEVKLAADLDIPTQNAIDEVLGESNEQ